MSPGKTIDVKFYLLLAVAAAVVMINLAAAAVAADAPSPAADSPAAAVAYINHTVGGAAGWFFNSVTNKSSSDYTAWAANQTFNLGDYLIFNTDSNSSVIQTYNLTTYQNCSIDDASDTDTSVYMSGSSDFGVGWVVYVPLTIVGPQYYFSQTDDGLQCQNGMAFEIKVGHGVGLPPSLNQPPPPPFVEPPSTVEEGQQNNVPVTTVTSPPNGGGMKVGGGGGGGGLLCVGMMMMALLSFIH